MNLHPTAPSSTAWSRPMLIVLGAAVLGVLVEAFLPRAHALPGPARRSAVGAQVAALVAVVHASGSTSARPSARPPSWARSPSTSPRCSCRAPCCWSACSAPADRRARIASEVDADDGRRRAWTRSPRRRPPSPGSVAEKVATKAGVAQTEMFPLTMFALGGMMLFPAADDLLTMFIALEVLVAAAVPAVRAGAAAAAAVAGSRPEVLPARRVLVGVLPLRRRAAVRLLRHA